MDVVSVIPSSFNGHFKLFPFFLNIKSPMNILTHLFVPVLQIKLLVPYTYCQTALQKIHSNLLSHQQHYNHNSKQSIKIIFCPFDYFFKEK